ncbi:hypothetical protein [Peterkaempfera bronchialis]|uniref:hypothetical protein n=1 Tax=Peterkaempfera bronchialis TaxID=2126346 RepID=UPI003C2F0A9F
MPVRSIRILVAAVAALVAIGLLATTAFGSAATRGSGARGAVVAAPASACAEEEPPQQSPARPGPRLDRRTAPRPAPGSAVDHGCGEVRDAGGGAGAVTGPRAGASYGHCSDRPDLARLHVLRC